jgi:hypothetical protein
MPGLFPDELLPKPKNSVKLVGLHHWEIFMFREQHYMYWLCQVGGGFDDAGRGGLHGHGVYVSPRHVITAHHIFTEAPVTYDWPMILGHAGHWRAKHVAEFEELDLAVVEICDRLDKNEGALERGPILFPERPPLGLSVGVLSHCEGLLDRGTSFRRTCFSLHSVMMEHPQYDSRFVLTHGLVQNSFSGSPAYTSSYELVGLLVGFTELPLDMDNSMTATLRCPIMSSVFPIRKELARLSQNKCASSYISAT